MNILYICKNIDTTHLLFREIYCELFGVTLKHVDKTRLKITIPTGVHIYFRPRNALIGSLLGVKFDLIYMHDLDTALTMEERELMQMSLKYEQENKE